MTFGDKSRRKCDDHVAAGPNEDEIGAWGRLLGGIARDLERLELGLVEMAAECLRLEAAGMWPAVPSESWETRGGGDPVYLRLVFPKRTAGLNGRKVYVGAKPEKIADARRKTANRQRWEWLNREIRRLRWTLRWARNRLDRTAGELAGQELPEDLGTGAAPSPDSTVTKEGEGEAC